MLKFSMNPRGRALSFALALILAATLLPAAAFAGEWDDFRGAEDGYTHTLTPRTAGESVLKWQKTFDRTATWNTVSTPIIAEGHIYVAVSNRLYKLGKDGSQKGFVELGTPAAPAEIGYASFIAYGGGKIFVPLKGGDIQAFRASDLQPLWISDYSENTAYPKVKVKIGAKEYVTDPAITTVPGGVPLTYKAETRALYNDGYLYCGVYYLHSNAETYGSFFAIKADEDDPSDMYENRPFAWEYEEQQGSLRGYYWAGVTAASGYVLFAGDAGRLYAASTGAIRAAEANPAPSPITYTAIVGSVSLVSGSGSWARAGMMYEGGAAGAGTAWLTTKNGRLWSVPFNSASGVFGQARSAALSGGAGASIPVVAGGKAYALSGGIGEGGKLDVFDKSTLARKSTIDFGGYSQSSPLISDAYAKPSNGNKVYMYIALNEALGDQVIVVEDSDKLPKPRSSVLYRPGGNQSLNSLIADSSGIMYFADGQGRLNAMGSKKFSYDPVDDVHKITLDANGGSVAAKSYEAVNGGKLPAVATPKRTGYKFAGWYLDRSFGTAYKAGATAQLGTDITLYAKWSANKYKVTFNANKGKALKKSARSKSVAYGAKYGKLPTPKRKGYKFKGWYTKKSGGSKITANSRMKTAKASTLYARWR